MPKYQLQKRIEVFYEKLRADGPEWVLIDGKTLESRIFEFPNEIREDGRLFYFYRGEKRFERIVSTSHSILGNYTLVELSPLESKKNTKLQAEKELKKILNRYAFIERL